jgi:hypothetical protein
MKTIVEPQNLKSSFFYALTAHLAFVGALFLIQLFQKAIPPERVFSPLEVIIMGNLDLEEVKDNSRLRTSIQDLREGVVIAPKNTLSKKGEVSAIPAPPSGGTGKLGNILSMTQNLGKAPTHKTSNADDKSKQQVEKERLALAVVEKSLRDDFIKGSKGEDQNGTGGLRVVNRLPEKVKGIEFKQVEAPKIKTPANLSAEEVEKLRLYFATKWIDIRDCYERALQKDEKLNGYVNLQVIVGAQGKTERTIIDFKGEGNPNAERSLKTCLEGVTGSMSFSEKLNGQTLQVGYRLSS